MLTIFSIPKPFKGHIGTIQRNGIYSWTLLRPRPEIILFGDEQGTGDLCKELKLRHVSDIKKNEYGTPLLNDIFEKIHRLASYNTLCFLNADIIMAGGLIPAAERAAKIKKRFLMSGERWDIYLTELLDYSNPKWEADLMDSVRKYGIRHGFRGVDYHVFPKGIFYDIPPFAVGRMYYDNWLIWRARSLGIPVINVTGIVTSIHQDHERTYESVGIMPFKGENSLRDGVEAKENLKLAGGNFDRIFNLLDSTHAMTEKAILLVIGAKYLKRRLEILRAQKPAAKLVVQLLSKILDILSMPAPVPQGAMNQYRKKFNIDLEYLLAEKKLIKVERSGRIYYKFNCLSDQDLLFLPRNSKKIIDLYRDSCLLKNKIKWAFKI